jgi:hypothetical protein
MIHSPLSAANAGWPTETEKMQPSKNIRNRGENLTYNVARLTFTFTCGS